MKASTVRLIGASIVLASAAGAAAGCNNATAPEEARVPFVEGIYQVETEIVENSCRQFNVIAGSQIFVFFQDGRTLEFRPPSFDGSGNVELLDLGIQGEIQRDGRFEMTGTYTLTPTGTAPGPVIGVRIEGRFTGNFVEGLQHQLASFPGGSCAVTFSFEGEEI